MPGAKERKPGPNAPRATIIAWLRQNWSGAMTVAAPDCDRCPQRAQVYPCGKCHAWNVLVENHRRD